MPTQAMRNQRMKQQLQHRQQARPQAKPQGAPSLKQEMNTSLPAALRPGNVGAINRVIWPFWFTFTAPELAPNTSSQGFFTVTQEAAFVFMSMTKSVFKKTVGPTQYTYIDPNDETGAGQADGLKWTMRDAQSSRVFSNLPVEMDHFGHPDYPFVLSTPILFLPNSTIEMTYQNDNASDTYVPFITLFGYRVRVEDAQHLLGTVIG
ncbi:MAG: hypothetical protein H7836_04455 [Magnetococcus sp. YQC-3]